MPRNNTDPRIDTSMESLPVEQQATCRRVRNLAHTANPELVKTIRWLEEIEAS